MRLHHFWCNGIKPVRATFGGAAASVGREALVADDALAARAAALEDPPLSLGDGTFGCTTDPFQKIRRRHDADEVAVFHDWKAADAPSAEQIGNLADCHVRRCRYDVSAPLRPRSVSIPRLSHVPVRDDAHDLHCRRSTTR